MENSDAARNNPLVLQLPMPNGTMEPFAVYESPIMEPELAAAYPMIKTFAGAGLDNSGLTTRFDLTLNGFNAIVHGSDGTVLVEPQENGYASFFAKNMQPAFPFQCGSDEEMKNIPLEPSGIGASTGLRGRNSAVVNLQTYRLAIGTTAEYSTSKGGTVASVLSAVTTVVNQVNSIFEKENAIRLVLISNTTETFFFPPNSNDPYTNGNLSACLNENPGVMNAAYTIDGYDIAHVFGTQSSGGTIGLASVGVVCGVNKARGASNDLFGVPFYSTVVHEFGHQFSARHNFNNCDGMNENGPTAYEPGGGTTIMCYAGACSSNSIQNDHEDYFHNNSLVFIHDFSRDPNSGGACAQVVPINNTAPEVDIPIAGGFYIPIGTPFELNGFGADADGDNLTYTWEQYDLGPLSPLGMPLGTAPLFRSIFPSNSTKRVFPKIGTIINNTTDKAEVLPNISRVMTFRLTARDNRSNGGAWGYEEIQFNATADAGPFVVTAPNASGITWEVGEYREVTWNVANTNNAPVNCKFVNIKLSKDGGLTYPVTLLANTPNDGSAFVVVPDELTTKARVRVEAAGSIFFDISNADFAIEAPSQPGFALSHSPQFGEVCIPDVFEVNLKTTALLGFSDTITFSVTGLPAGAATSFSANPIVAGEETTLTIDFSDVTDDNQFVVVVNAETDSLPVAARTVDLNVVYNDFSALKTTSPADGLSGETTLPVFIWTAMPNALTYDIEVSDNPSFAEPVDQATGLTQNEYSASVTLEDNTPYYWRVRGVNECGAGPFTEPSSFHTVSQACITVPSSHAPITISASGLPSITAPINVTQSGAISDINVKAIKGKYTPVGVLEFRLKGPDGTVVKLMSKPPCAGGDFNMGFDDQSPNTPSGCPSTGLIYQPLEPLSIFNDKNVQGEWNLEIAALASGYGGTFQTWSLEYCAALQSENPFLEKNDTLEVPPNGARLIYKNKLVVEDTDNPAHELQFTIVKNTDFGTVYLKGEPLGAGGHFTMQNIYASEVEYANADPDALYDYFTFTVHDGQGGFLGTPRFNIKMDPNAAPDGTMDVQNEREVLVYPNPTSGLVAVELRQPVQGKVEVALSNIQGQLLKLVALDQAADKIQLETSDLPAGLYLIQVKTERGLVVKKLVKE